MIRLWNIYTSRTDLFLVDALKTTLVTLPHLCFVWKELGKRVLCWEVSFIYSRLLRFGMKIRLFFSYLSMFCSNPSILGASSTINIDLTESPVFLCVDVAIDDPRCYWYSNEATTVWYLFHIYACRFKTMFKKSEQSVESYSNWLNCILIQTWQQMQCYLK